MQETIQNIIERVNFEKKDNFSRFLYACIKDSHDTAKSTYAIHNNILFKTAVFFEGLAKVSNEVPKEKKLLLGVETLVIVFDELGIEIEKEDAFILFHLRDLGKFKIKDKKLLAQLKGPWGQYKEFALEDADFSHSLKGLRKAGIINYRKGSVSLEQNIVISYKK